jgi:hypothetical protein
MFGYVYRKSKHGHTTVDLGGLAPFQTISHDFEVPMSSGGEKRAHPGSARQKIGIGFKHIYCLTCWVVYSANRYVAAKCKQALLVG